MARSVRSRGPAVKAQTYAESDDSGGETETEEQEWNEHPANGVGKASSRPSGKYASKRPIRADVGDKENTGDGYVPNGAGGASGSGGKTAVGLKRTETAGKFNDDEAEKRKRRKSAKLLGQQTTMFDSLADSGSGASGLNAGKQPVQLNSVVPAAPIINVPRDVMNSNFEEWMKMATDNKINANNSWNFALIDYFHDMSLLRNNTDNSINFQRASCTLDGCVKIWTSRVDSVNDETNKLLRGVRDGPGGGDSDNEEEREGGDGGPGFQRTQRKGTHRAESTLAKSAAQLRSKKLDLEFSVDPLFKKTCADFDEGGAHGLLMNHLSLGVGIDGGGLRVVFDASDAVAKSGDDEEADEVEPAETVDLSELRAQFFSNLDDLDYKSIAPSLREFSFSGHNFSFDEDHNSLYRDDTFAVTQGGFDDDDVGDNDPIGYTEENVGDGVPLDGDDTQEPAPVQDFFSSDQADQEGYAGGGDFGGDDDFGGDGEGGSIGADADHHADGDIPGQGRGTFVPFDPARGPNERDLIMAMMDPDAEGGTMDYFDKNVIKNWAGPEHWKLRKVIRKPTGEQSTAAIPKPKREKKEAFKIDFHEPLGMSVKEFAKEKFAPPTRGVGINLPGYSLPSSSKPGKKGKKNKEKEKERREEQVLPDDMHFSSRQLVTLFLKPNFSLKTRGRRISPKTNADGEIDENFWAQAAADQAAGRSGEDGNENGNDPAIPFNTQFFHDDFDDDAPGFDDGDDGGGIGSAVPGAEGEEPDLMATLAGSSRRVRPQYVNYTKKAKRVDVRKLKENIWNSLDIKIPKPKDPDESMDVDDGDEGDFTHPNEHRVFDSVVSNLRKTYPKDKMQDISTSFCFICLLHLANERGLKIEVGESPDAEGEGEPEEGDNKVGDLWGLKVFRDPNVIHSA